MDKIVFHFLTKKRVDGAFIFGAPPKGGGGPQKTLNGRCVPFSNLFPPPTLELNKIFELKISCVICLLGQIWWIWGENLFPKKNPQDGFQPLLEKRVQKENFKKTSPQTPTFRPPKKLTFFESFGFKVQKKKCISLIGFFFMQKTVFAIFKPGWCFNF